MGVGCYWMEEAAAELICNNAYSNIDIRTTRHVLCLLKNRTVEQHKGIEKTTKQCNVINTPTRTLCSR